MRPFEVDFDRDCFPSRSEDKSTDKMRLSLVLVDDDEMELFDTISIIASLSYLLQVRECCYSWLYVP